jgi:hypothetical protein
MELIWIFFNRVTRLNWQDLWCQIMIYIGRSHGAYVGKSFVIHSARFEINTVIYQKGHLYLILFKLLCMAVNAYILACGMHKVKYKHEIGSVSKIFTRAVTRSSAYSKGTLTFYWFSRACHKKRKTQCWFSWSFA